MSWVVEWEGGLRSGHNKRPFQSVTTASLADMDEILGNQARFFSSSLVLLSYLPLLSLETSERDQDGDRSWPV